MARPGYSTGMIQPYSLTGTALVGAALLAITSKTKFMQFRMPCKGKVIGITLNVNQAGGTIGAGTVVDVLAGATSLLTTPFAVDTLTPGTPVDKEGTNLSAAASSVAKDTIIGVSVTVVGGSSPTWADISFQLDFAPLGE